MKPSKSYFHPLIRLALTLALGAVLAPAGAFAAGPGGLAIGFGSAVHRIMASDKTMTPFAGVSDPISLRAADNINTHGFALRRDGAY